MILYGQGRAAILGDPVTARRLGWEPRSNELPQPEIVLEPRSGDPRREPWIAPPGWTARSGCAALWHAPGEGGHWSFLPDPPGVLRYLERLARPAPRHGVTVAVAGVGRVGGVAATHLAATPCAVSGVRELLIYDVDGANLERWFLELSSIAAWRETAALPRVRLTSPEQLFNECDVFLFAATTGVPALGTSGDVRLVQFAPNRALLRGLLEQARTAAFSGLFVVVSDPVDWLAQAAFVDSNVDPSGQFTGSGLAPERIAGLGLGVMWGRALAAARREGWEAIVAQRGAAFGPHSTEVLVFDDTAQPSPQRSAVLTRAAREGNYLVRALGFLPYVGPGVASVGLTVPRLLRGEEIPASVFLDGLYFGAPARGPEVLLPAGGEAAPVVQTAVTELYGRLVRQAHELGLVFR